MKKIIICLAILVLAAGCAAWFTIPSLVEKAVRQNLEQLPAVLNQPGQVTFSKPEIGKISFEPMGRTLSIANTTINGVANDKKLGKVNMVYRFKAVSGTMPWRLLAKISPLRGMLSEQYGFETVLSDFQGKEWSVSLASKDLQAESAIEEISGTNIMLQANVLGSILDQLPLDSLDIIYGMGVDDFFLKGIGGNFTALHQKQVVTHNLGSMRISGWRGQTTKNIAVDGLSLRQGENILFGLDQLDLNTLTLPEMPLMVALKNDLQEFRPFRSWHIFSEIMKGKPIVSQSVLKGLHVEDFAINSARLDWFSTNPTAANLSLAGLSFPASVLEDETGVNVTGMKKIDLDCDLSVEGGKNSSQDHKGSIRAPGLGALAFSYSTSSTPTSILSLMSAKFSDFDLNYVDESLVARVAAGIEPNAQAAMFALKIAAGHFCSQSGKNNENLRQAIENFVERPGSLQVKGCKPFNLTEIGIQAYRGDLGSIFEATATPGSKTLEQEMNALKK